MLNSAIRRAAMNETSLSLKEVGSSEQIVQQQKEFHYLKKFIRRE